MLNEDLHHTDVHRPDLRFSKKLSSDILTIQTPGRCTRETCSELFTTMDWSNILSLLNFSSSTHASFVFLVHLSSDHRFVEGFPILRCKVWPTLQLSLFNYIFHKFSEDLKFEEDLTLVQQLCSPSKYKHPDL